MRGRTGLVEARDRHAVLRPSGRRPQSGGLRRALRAAMAGAMPVVRIHALEIERALDHAGEDLVIGQIRREPAQIVQMRQRNLVLDGVPVPPFGEVVGLEADDLQRVAPLRRARGIGHGRTDREQGRVLDIHGTAGKIVAHAQRPGRLGQDPGCDGRDRAARDRALRRLGGRVMGDEHRQPGLPGVDRVDEVLAPRLARRHGEEMLDVHGREHRLPGAIAAAIAAFDTDTASILDDQLLHRLARQHRAAMLFDQPRQCIGQCARAALRHAPAVSAGGRSRATRRAGPTSAAPAAPRSASPSRA